MYTAEEGEVDKVLLITTDLSIVEINLSTFEIEELCTSQIFKASTKNTVNKLRAYDRIITLSHFNPLSQQLFVHFANFKLFSMVDLKSKSVVWNLPQLTSCGLPLSMTSDMDKLLVAYETNKIIVFDLLSK